MKYRFVFAAALVLIHLDTAMPQEVLDFSETINEFRSVDAVAPYFDTAYGYAVWRRIARGGLGVGAATGKGQVYRSGEVTGFSRLVDVTIGFQAGGQVYKQIVFFQDERAYDEFTSGNFQFDAAASAVAVTASAQANASTQGSQATAGTGGAASTGVAGGYERGVAGIHDVHGWVDVPSNHRWPELQLYTRQLTNVRHELASRTSVRQLEGNC